MLHFSLGHKAGNAGYFVRSKQVFLLQIFMLQKKLESILISKVVMPMISHIYNQSTSVDLLKVYLCCVHGTRKI